MILDNFVYSVYALWFFYSQDILIIHHGLVTANMILTDYGYPVYTHWFSYNQVNISRFRLLCLFPMAFLQPS